MDKRRGQPFAKRRIVYDHVDARFEPCKPRSQRLIEIIEGQESSVTLGLFQSRRQYLNYSREEPLDVTADSITAYFAWVAQELQQPFTMGFMLECDVIVGQSASE